MPKEKKIVGIKPAEKKEEEKQDLSRVPKPTGWRLVVLPYRGVAKTKGGVLLTDKAVEEQQMIAQMCDDFIDSEKDLNNE